MAVQSGIWSRVEALSRGAVPARKQAVATATRGFYIQYRLKGELKRARKLDPSEFTPAHLNTLATASLTEGRELVFNDPKWHSVWLGAGEEKTVYLVVDQEGRGFALEILVKEGYLNGRLTEGYYLADLRLSNISGIKRDSRALLSLSFSGEAKAREFIYGETLAGPACRSLAPSGTRLQKFINAAGQKWAHYATFYRYRQLTRTFKDAHEANVMIELIPLHNPERKRHLNLPIPALAQDGHLHWYFFRLTPIDVRALAR